MASGRPSEVPLMIPFNDADGAASSYSAAHVIPSIGCTSMPLVNGPEGLELWACTCGCRGAFTSFATLRYTP
jgi:hypothetical protein